MDAANAFQSRDTPFEPIEVNLFEGSCGPGLPSNPQVRIRGADSQEVRTGTASLRSHQTAGFTRTTTIEAMVFFSPFEGHNTIELEFDRGVVRTTDAFFVTPQESTTTAAFDGRCTGHPFVGPQFVACTISEGNEVFNVTAFSIDGGVSKLASARLWTTAQGRLVTTSSELGWWPEGTALADWRGTASLTSDALAVAANLTLVAVWQKDAVLVLRSRTDLSVELARIPLKPCDVQCSLGASLVMNQDAILISRRGSEQLAVFDGTWQLLPETTGALWTVGRDDQLWRCNGNQIEWGRLEGRQVVISASGYTPVQCAAWPGGERPSASGGNSARSILMCPQVDGAAITWRAVKLFGGELGGGCFENSAYTYSGADVSRTRIATFP
ncbi:MAG: hypothetical protein Q8L48_41930 [Archangium sp.]|nr:hypothetical protein [Archangium sp.]